MFDAIQTNVCDVCKEFIYVQLLKSFNSKVNCVYAHSKELLKVDPEKPATEKSHHDVPRA